MIVAFLITVLSWLSQATVPLTSVYISPQAMGCSNVDKYSSMGFVSQGEGNSCYEMFIDDLFELLDKPVREETFKRFTRIVRSIDRPKPYRPVF